MGSVAPSYLEQIEGLDETAVVAQLRRILDSALFCNSKRYPALLEYVVLETLAGNVDKLKERTIGIEVFHRPADYDSNADPVVRVTAGEVRKRIAQYYHEPARASELRIDLPSGSYVAEFRAASAATLPVGVPVAVPVTVAATVPMMPPALEPPHHAEPAPANKNNLWRTVAIWLMVLVVALLAVGYSHWSRIKNTSLRETPMWGLLTKMNEPVLLVVGPLVWAPDAPSTEQPGYVDHSQPIPGLTFPDKGERLRGVGFPDVSALTRVVGALSTSRVPWKMLRMQATTISDLRNNPVIVIGGFNNSWTRKLLMPLRFTLDNTVLAKDGTSERVLRIVDRKNESGPWLFRGSTPYGNVTKDYAIVGRFHDETTDGVTMVIAGLESWGTESAADLVTSPELLREFDQQAPKHWENKNMEAVIEVEVIDGRPGHSRVVAADFW